MNHASEIALQLIALQDALGGRYGELSRPKLRLMIKLTDGAVKISDIADRLHISSPAVSQMIDKLQMEGYVTRHNSSDDLRIVSISLTGKGQSALETALQSFQERVDSLMTTLDSDETRIFTQLLMKMTAGDTR